MVFVDKTARDRLKSLWTDLSPLRRMPVRDAAARTQSDDLDRALRELRAMPDYQLLDIGLSRSDLTPEGLAAAGTRRGAKQGAIAAEIARKAEGKAWHCRGD